MYKYQLLERVLIQVNSNDYLYVIVDRQNTLYQEDQLVNSYYVIRLGLTIAPIAPITMITSEERIWGSRGVLSIEEGLTHPYSKIRSVAKRLNNVS